MYRLYWHPNASSLAPMAVLEELGVAFELHELDYDGGETRRSEYLRLQPLGLIPALGLGNGSSMFESAAIVQYLCDAHLLRCDSRERGEGECCSQGHGYS